MRALLLGLVLCTSCARETLTLPVDTPESDVEAVNRGFAWSDEAAERRLREAATPGFTMTQRRAHLRAGTVDALLDEGRWLLVTDTPWAERPAPLVRPLHLAGETSADGTRCVGCHHAGGLGGAGAFADRTFLNAEGDAVTTAVVRAPRMLAGVAALELLGVPLGWTGEHSRLNAAVEHGVSWHLGERALPDELDALVTAIAALPVPTEENPERDSLRLRVSSGRALFESWGCASCHVVTQPLSNFTLTLPSGRRLNLEPHLRAQLGVSSGPVALNVYSDFQKHDIGTGTKKDPGPFFTPPLWGSASRLTFLHDARATTFNDAIRAHAGEATAAREKWLADQPGQRDLMVFLLTLTRPTRLEVSP